MPNPVSRDFAVGAVHQNVGRLEVLVDKIALVQLAHRHGDADGETQEAPDLQGGAEQPLERLETADVLEHQHRAAAIAHDLQRPDRPRSVQLFLQSVFVGEAIEARARRVRSDGQDDQDGAPAAVLTQTPPSAEDAFAVLPQNLIAATLIAFASKRERRNVADGARTAIAHSRGRTGCLGRNRHFADARGYSEIGSFGVQRFCTRVHRRSF